ncbi:MAG: prepilin peptidase [Planctomycetota bacterium]
MPSPPLFAFEVVALVGFFILGSLVGSFLNVCIWRLPRGATIGRPRRSFCPRCGRTLRWHDNVPLLSFVLLRGRCRYCGGRISGRYPAVELLTALLFPLIYHRQGIQVGTGVGQLTLMMLMTALLIVAAAIDVEFLIIPDEIVVFGMLGGLLAGFLLPGLHVGQASYHTYEALTGHVHLDGLIGAVVGAVGGGGIVLLFALFGAIIFQQEALGFGDVKLMAMVGAFFGWKVVLIAFFLGPFFGLLYGIPVLVMHDEHVMPYGPFLAMGAVLALIFRGELTYYAELIEELARMILG